MSHRRPVSGTERAWLVASERYPPFCNQMVVEGTGSLDHAAWEAAVAKVSAVHPGARLVARGSLCKQHWIDDSELRLREVTTDWDGRSNENAPFLQTPLNPWTGPTAEVLLMHGPTPRVAIRTLHAAMDGGGTLALAQDLFRALRGEALVGGEDIATELELAKHWDLPASTIPDQDAASATGRPSGPATEVLWKRVTVPGTHRGMLGKLTHAVAAHARAHAHDAEPLVRVDIPVDLRRHAAREIHSTANLTGVLDLVIPATLSPTEIVTAIKEGVANGRHAARVKAHDALRHVPLWVMDWFASRQAASQTATGHYGTTAVLSNLGRIDLSGISCHGFTATSCYFIPPGTPVTAMFAAFAGTPDGVELLVALPDTLADGGRLDQLIDVMVRSLTEAS